MKIKNTILYMTVFAFFISFFAPLLTVKANAADTYYAALDDYDDVLTDEEEADVLEVLQKSADSAHYNIGVVITDELGGRTDREYAEYYLDINFGRTGDSVVMMILNTHGKAEYSSYVDRISLCGKSELKLQSKVDTIFTSFYDTLGKSGYAAAFGTFANDVVYYSGNGEYNTESSEGYRAVLDDFDECLTPTEETELLKAMQEAAEEANCHIGIVITNDLKGKSDKKFADDYLDLTFGTGSTAVVLMLLNSHNNPEYEYYKDQISTSGEGCDKYDLKIDQMFDMVYDKLEKSDGSFDFYNGCLQFCKAAERYGNKSGSYSVREYDTEYYGNSFGISPTLLIAAFIVALIFSLVIVSIIAHGYKKKKKTGAAAYLKTSSTRITNSVDTFIREYTTVINLSSSSGGGGGGHHGGGGGGHHSGGHGGGGGHHR